MSTTHAPAPPSTSTGRDRFSLGRTLRLARWNAVLLGRNKLSLLYAVVMPLAPLALLFAGDRGDATIGVNAAVTVLLVTVLFPVYYNVLSQFVSRRDELVLKRMRTGEAKDSELLAGIALPGVVAAAAVTAASVVLAWALGQPLPLAPIVLAAGVLLALVMFVAFAYWTAAWTRSAESAQMTSLPIILIASIGPLGAGMTSLSDPLREIVERTPGAAMSEIVRLAWYGFDGASATESTLSAGQVWDAAGSPLLVMAAWTVVAIFLAKRSMRWEPRS
jgi:ABC-2 type transport system permease protein